MRNLIIIISNFYKLTFTNVFRYLLFFVLPVIVFIAAIFLFGASQTRGIIVGYVNEDNGSMGQDLVEKLSIAKNNPLVSVKQVNINNAILEGQIDLAIIIPKDFSEKLQKGDNVDINLISLEGDKVTTFIEQPVNQFIRQVLGLHYLSQSSHVSFNQLYYDLIHSTYSLEITEVSDKGLSQDIRTRSFGFFFFLIMLQATIITALMLLDKKENTYFRIRMTPIKEMIYSLGNMLAAFFILSIQILLTLVIIVMVVKIDLLIPLSSLIPVLLCYALAAVGVGLVITSLSKNPTQANMAASLILQPTFFLSGCFIPSTILPGFLQKVSSIFPQSWAMRAIEELINGADLGDIAFHLFILIGFTGLFMALFALKMKNDQDRAV